MIGKYFEPYNVWACHALVYDPRLKGLLSLKAEEAVVVRTRAKAEVRSLEPAGHSGRV